MADVEAEQPQSSNTPSVGEILFLSAELADYDRPFIADVPQVRHSWLKETAQKLQKLKARLSRGLNETYVQF